MIVEAKLMIAEARRTIVEAKLMIAKAKLMITEAKLMVAETKLMIAEAKQMIAKAKRTKLCLIGISLNCIDSLSMTCLSFTPLKDRSDIRVKLLTNRCDSSIMSDTVVSTRVCSTVTAGCSTHTDCRQQTTAIVRCVQQSFQMGAYPKMNLNPTYNHILKLLIILS